MMNAHATGNTGSEKEPQKAIGKSGPQPGDTLFALFMVIAAGVLLSQIGTQTKWVKGVSVFLQPRFWPGICLGGMLLFAFGYFVQSVCDVRRQEGKVSNHSSFFPRTEFFNWLKTSEYAIYFLIYVYSIPKLGHLFATLLFCPLMTLRAGYRGLKPLSRSMLGGFVIVLIFKTFLKIKLPAGQLYDLLPDPIGKFLTLYF